MSDRLLSNVKNYLGNFFERHGFVQTSYHSDEPLGSGVELKSDEFWILLVNDRGQVFCQVGANKMPRDNNSYFDLWYVAQFLGHDDFPRDYSGSMEEQTKRIADYLINHEDEIFTEDLLVNRFEEMKSDIDEQKRRFWEPIREQALMNSKARLARHKSWWQKITDFILGA